VRNKIFVLIVFVSSVLLFLSCNDSPTDIGSDLLTQDGVQISKFDSSIDSIYQASSSYKNVKSLSSSNSLLLGKAENITSHVLFKFVFSEPDSIKKDISNDSLNILDSWIELYKTYTFGDSTNNFNYEAYKVNTDWSSYTFTSDSFPNLQYDKIDLASSKKIDSDTVYSFKVDKDLVKSWLQNYTDTTIAKNYGLLLSPTDDCQHIVGFQAYNAYDLNDPILRIVVQKEGSYIDTLIGYVASDLSIVLGNEPSVGTSDIAIQPSLCSEGKLYFDFSAIPPNSVINSATLTLTLNTSKTVTGSSYNSSLSIYPFSDSTKKEVYSGYGYTLSRSGNTFTGSITNIVRAYNNHLSNQGMVVLATNEIEGAEIFAIYGSNAVDISNRPRLQIVYSRKK
jgi:hypothetical protein